MGKKVVIVCTSAADLGPMPTGAWIEEIACPYYIFIAEGWEVEIASLAGGPVPIDAGSMAEGFFTEDSKKFMHDPKAFGALSHSKKISSVNVTDFDALYCAGGHGAFVDYTGEAGKDLTAAIEKMWAAGKVVGSDCHGPVCLADPKKPDGTPLVAGLTVTGFTNAEEFACGFDGSDAKAFAPFYIEDKLKALGAKWEAAEQWTSKVCVDGKLVTGQNPQSSKACAKAIIAAAE